MYRLFITFFIFTLIQLSGCATQQPVQFSAPVEKGHKVSIIVAEPFKPAAQYTGAIGLLDLAIIATANRGLNSHLGSLSFDDYSKLPKSLQDILEEKGFEVEIIEKQLNTTDLKKIKNLNKTKLLI